MPIRYSYFTGALEALQMCHGTQKSFQQNLRYKIQTAFRTFWALLCTQRAVYDQVCSIAILGRNTKLSIKLLNACWSFPLYWSGTLQGRHDIRKAKSALPSQMEPFLFWEQILRCFFSYISCGNEKPKLRIILENWILHFQGLMLKRSIKHPLDQNAHYIILSIYISWLV